MSTFDMRRMQLRKQFENMQKAMGTVQDAVETLLEQCESAQTTAAELRDNYDKDADIAELQARIAELERERRHSFPISEDESLAIREWQLEHEKTVHNLVTEEQRIRAQGCSGGRYTYIFLPTGIGTAGKIRCSCGAEFEFQHLG